MKEYREGRGIAAVERSHAGQAAGLPIAASIEQRAELMKAILYAALGAALLAAALPVDANAVVCAKGVYRAGCAGPHGAVVAPRGAVVAPRCVYRAGVRVCK